MNSKNEVMSEMTFKQIYDSLPVTPPKTAWIRRVAKVTKKSELTIRMWLSGRQTPDPLTQSVIEKELGIPAGVLFPPKTKEQ